jgi:DNA-directed RNA polymerase specialized sigma24 family protein
MLLSDADPLAPSYPEPLRPRPPPPPPRGPDAAPLHLLLGDTSLVDRLAAFVGRAVPAGDVRDVLHQVVREALDAPAAPTDRDEVRRWLFGIARHKIADFHRLRRRVFAPVDPEQLASRPAPIEARSLLRRVLADATRDPRGAQTMSWLLREADGEQLETLAHEAALPPATVRQRVSRMRRWLRKRWGEEALLLAALSLVGVAMVRGWHPSVDGQTTTMSADPGDDTAAAALVVLQGRWHVASVVPAATVPPAGRAVVEVEALATTIEVTGDQMTVRSPSRRLATSLQPGPVADRAFTLRLVEAGGSTHVVTVRVEGPDRLVITRSASDGGGSLVLEQQQPHG